MARGTRSQKNIPPSSVSSSLLEELASPPEESVSLREVTPAPSDMRLLNAPALDAPVPTLAPAHYSKEDFQLMMKVRIDLILQAQVICLTEPASYQEGQLKARLPDLNYGKSHMEYYYFWQQCENYFDTAVATDSNRTPFAASFIRNRINFQWHKHKLRNQAAKSPWSWVEFKAFLQKNLEDSKAFVDTV